MMFFRWLNLLFFIVLLQSCSVQETHRFVFPSVEMQQHLISTDTVDFYFENVRPVDIFLQLGSFDSIFFQGLRHLYSESLSESVKAFSREEQKQLQPLLNGIYQNLHTLNPALAKDSIYLVKTDGRHYGAGTWFTRQQSIIMPENAISNLSEDDLLSVLYHEVFHIISRYHPKLRQALYSLIGFERPKYHVTLPPELDSMVLLNPDGVDFQYVFEFEPGLFGMPLIYAGNLDESARNLVFFDHLNFAFFRVENDQLLNDPIAHEDYPAFRHAIGNLTNYIIHPDEILADYFAAIMLREYQSGQAEQLNPHDRAIFEQIHHTLKSYQPE